MPFDREPPASDLRAAALAHGDETVSFQTLEPHLARRADDGPDGTGAVVAFADTAGGWVAAGSPLVARERRADAASRFAEAARRAGRRASFFAVERPGELGGLRALEIGAQPVFDPAAWADRLRQFRRLREQIRRAGAKGVAVRRVAPDELAPGLPLRAEVDALAARWLADRHMAAMRFLVALELHVEPDQHRYFAAERGGHLVAFLSLVPVPARGGWLFEDLVRAPDAPNGTSELLIDAAMRDLAAAGARRATFGLAPLAGGAPAWARALGWIGRPLYDFRGIRAFKERLHPQSWEPVYLAHGRGAAALHVLDALRAFAGGSLVRFGWRTLIDHPSGLPLSLALPLVPWTALLAVLLALGRSALLGFAPLELAGWILFDAVLAVGLLRAARRPRRRILRLLCLAAAVDAALSIAHLAAVGPGDGLLAAALRALATAAPVGGTLALVLAAARARA
ncbi:MAG TPA: DUF2156 domain-containing protein [Kofleriaceae bacterium]|nr:DUF2156 domain-containing protein [Kofleriaceae bacterium]